MRQRPVQRVLDDALTELLHDAMQYGDPWVRKFYRPAGYGFVGPSGSRLKFIRDNFTILARDNMALRLCLIVLRERGMQMLLRFLVTLGEAMHAIRSRLVNLWHKILFGRETPNESTPRT